MRGSLSAVTDDEFGALYTALSPVVYGYAARRVGAERAKDITSETFTVAWEKRHEYPGDSESWPAWTIGIARNKVLQDIQRRERKHHDHRLATDWMKASTEPSAEDFSGAVVDSVRARTIFAALTPAEQDLFGIAFLHDLSPADGAGVLGISTTAYTTRVSRLRQRLRDLDAMDDGPHDTMTTRRPTTR